MSVTATEWVDHEDPKKFSVWAEQGEPVARVKLTDAERRKWLLDGCPELWMQKDGVGPGFIKPVQPATRYVREDLAAPASAGVTVKPLVEQVASLIDGVMADDAEGIDRLDDAARLLERILAALSQPAQDK